MSKRLNALDLRKKYQGLIGIQVNVPVKDRSSLSILYTPGVAEPCRVISARPEASFELTCRSNSVALITDGSRVLGLGNLGPFPALPIMEGKSAIFKAFSGVDAFPLCLDTQNEEEIVQTVCMLAPSFGAICLEDISAPRCFAIEEKLKQAMNIPVIDNDQHAAAALALAALINSAKVVQKKIRELSVVICGAGAAGIATAKLLLAFGIKDILLCDTRGALYKYRVEGMNWAKFAIAKRTNPGQKKGPLHQVIQGADCFIGFSRGEVLDADMVQTMARSPIILAFANPAPEISIEEAKKGGAGVVALSTGKEPHPNELNIAMIFPGIFRGLLDVAAREFSDSMKIAAARALARIITRKKLREDHILPDLFDFQTAPVIAGAVAKEAMASDLARRHRDPRTVIENMEQYIYEGEFPIPQRSEDVTDIESEALDIRRRHRCVIGIKAKIPVKDRHIMSLLYLPPAAAEVPIVIAKDPNKVFDLTCKNNLVGVISDGSAVLGLGNIGPRAALPVMEGKCILFHTFGAVEAYPICIGTQVTEEIISVIKQISPAFGGINLEDISSPRCFEIEQRLIEELDIPVFHDDQHGTAVVTLAGLINALKIVGKEIDKISIVISGSGAAATAVARMLLLAGAGEILICDRRGILYEGRKEGMNRIKEEMAGETNHEKIKGDLEKALEGRDVFIGLSSPGIVTARMISSMARDPICFAMANPIPEIMPKEAKKGGAKIVATGRSDFANQVNNCLGFPGIFRGALDVQAKRINEAMKLAAASALAGAVMDEELSPEYILPEAMNFRVPPLVAAAVARAAIESGVARKKMDPDTVFQRATEFIYEGRPFRT